MSVIDTWYPKAAPSLHATFEDGSLPSWLSEDVSGDASVTVNTGEAVLSTGTTSDDYARIRGNYSNAATPDEYGAIGIKARLEMDASAASSGDAVVLTGLQDSDDSDTMLHFPNHASSSNSRIRASQDGTETNVDTAKYHITEPVTTQLVYDPSEGIVLHEMQGSYRQHIESNLPNPSLNLEADVFIKNKIDGTGRRVTVKELEVSFRDSLR